MACCTLLLSQRWYAVQPAWLILWKIPNCYAPDVFLKCEMHQNSLSVMAVPWTLLPVDPLVSCGRGYISLRPPLFSLVICSAVWSSLRCPDLSAEAVSSFLWGNLVPLGEEIPLELGHQRGVPHVRNRSFTTIGSSSVKTVADRHRLAAYHNKHCWWAFQWYQQRWSWTTLNPQNRGL